MTSSEISFREKVIDGQTSRVLGTVFVSFFNFFDESTFELVRFTRSFLRMLLDTPPQY